jgi:hypothetical protein
VPLDRPCSRTSPPRPYVIQLGLAFAALDQMACGLLHFTRMHTISFRKRLGNIPFACQTRANFP